jgi:hypothetical protein
LDGLLSLASSQSIILGLPAGRLAGEPYMNVCQFDFDGIIA